MTINFFVGYWVNDTAIAFYVIAEDQAVAGVIAKTASAFPVLGNHTAR
jgi:hypothetical protein